MTTLKTTVLQRGEARFTITGQKLPYILHATDHTITAGLAHRLRSYAEKRLDASGFSIKDMGCGVYTLDADMMPAERMYCVEFETAKGGKIGVQGILTRAGWPCLDHGLCIEQA